MVGGRKSEGLGGWRSGKLGLGCPPQRVSTSLGLQQFLETWSWFTLDPHSVWNVSGFLVVANLGWEEMAEIIGSDFRGLGLIEDLVIVLRVWNIYYFFSFLFFDYWLRGSCFCLGCKPEGNSTCSTPSGMEPGIRKLGTATLIWCRRRSLALITHLGPSPWPHIACHCRQRPRPWVLFLNLPCLQDLCLWWQCVDLQNQQKQRNTVKKTKKERQHESEKIRVTSTNRENQ